MKLKIDQTNNGYIVRIEDSQKNNGVYVFRSDEDVKMYEFLAALTIGRKMYLRDC